MKKSKPAKRVRRAHRVTGSIDNLDLTKASTALTLKLEHKGEKIGELTVGRGSVTWHGRNRKTGVSWTWSEFAAFLDRHGYDE
jgi:hypothetical protein